MSTIKDLKRWYAAYKHCKIGYVCYQDDNISKWDLVELGFNRGVYGWNWTTYADNRTDTLYISSYRNVPNYIKAK